MSSSSASDRDMSEGSSSPISYTLKDSPYSSPSQQVPQLTSNLTELSCAEKSFHFLKNGNQPQLKIIEQAQNHFRFRYVSEMVGTHGCLLGKSSSSNKTKTHPTVQLMNYNGRALIRCQLAQCDVEDEHPHRLLEDDQDRDVSSIVPEHNSYKVRYRIGDVWRCLLLSLSNPKSAAISERDIKSAFIFDAECKSFAGMGIIHTAKKDVPNLLFKKFSEKLKGQSYDPKELRTECDNLAKKMNLNIVRLKFSAHNLETGKEICKPVFSEPIHNMKSAATNDLKICRISQYTGRPRGGEDVFILVEKVNKKNIMIRFLELDESGEMVWSDTGSFLQSDVHHQYAIVFRTPPYRDPQTPVDVTVYIELVRPTDGRTSERKQFTYKAEQVYKQFKKRKTTSSYSSLDSSSGGSITNEIPTTVLFQNSNDTKDDNEMPLFTIQQLPLPAGSPGHCGLGSALGTSINNTMTSPINALGSPTNALGSPINLLTSPPQTAPMWSGAGFEGPSTSSIPNLRLHSSEIDQMTNDVQMTVDEQRALTEADWSQYVSSFNSLSDIQTEEQNPLGEFIRTSAFVSDSGRVKVEPSSSKTSPTHSEKSSSDVKEAPEYDAHYKPEDGLEVKKLVQELCQIIKNRKGYKNQEVKSKLERLFEIRLSNGDTFLHMTLCSNQPSFESIVKVISSVNMSHLLNYSNNKRETILHLAVFQGNPKMISFLISKGCNPMLKNCEDDNVIQYAVRYNYTSLEPILDAIKKNNVPCDLNACNNEKQTALHLAAMSDCCGSARVLLQHGASYNVRDAAGRTPLHLAAYDAAHSALRILLEHISESDVDALDLSGNTTLQIVCGITKANPASTLEMVKLLLKKKADPLKHEDDNESAWRLARHSPAIREAMSPYINTSALEDDVKSEPEDEFESADEDMPGTGMPELSLFAREVSERMDASGAWRDLAKRLRLDALTNWFANQNSPTYTLLHQIKECREDMVSKSLAFMLEDMGQVEAANIIRGYLD